MRDRLLLQIKRFHVNFDLVDYLDRQCSSGAIKIFDSMWEHET